MRKLFMLFLITTMTFFLNAQKGVTYLPASAQMEGGKYTIIHKTHKAPKANFAKDAILTEDFESGTLPTGWTQEYVNGTINWAYQSGGGHDGNPASAHSGSYNALFFDISYNNYETRLITPALDLSAGDYRLDYWLAMEDWSYDLDELHIYYKEGASGTWTEIASHTTEVADWTNFHVDIPSTSNEVYIAFDGIEHYGYGVCLDDISVYQVLQNDFSVIDATPLWVLYGDDVPFSVTVGNNGTDPHDTYNIYVIVDNGTDTLFTDTLEVAGTNIPPSEQHTFDMPDVWTNAPAGEYTLTAVVVLQGDQDNTNDTLRQLLNIVEPSYTNGYAYGYDVYGTYTDHMVKNDVTTGILEDLGNASTGNFLASCMYIDGKVFGIEYSSNDIYFVNGDGNAYLYGNIDAGGETPIGLDYNQQTGEVYLLTYQGSLYMVNEDLTLTSLSTLPATTGWIALAIDTSGIFYALNITDDYLCRINPTTGDTIHVGPIGFNANYAQDMAFDRGTNILYGALYDNDEGGGWYMIDTTVGIDTAANLIYRFTDEITGVAIVSTLPSYTITFNVVDQDNNPIDNAMITIGTDVLYTNTDGQATIDLPNGDYTAIITKDCFANDTVEFTVADAEQTVNSTLTLGTYTVTFNVTDVENNPIDNVTLTIDTNTITTDNNGQATIDLPCGDYEVTASKTGYTDTTVAFTVASADLTVDITLTQPTFVVDADNNVVISPNPTTGYITISAEDNYTVEVMSISGQVLQKINMNNNKAEIDLSKYNSGVYIVKLISDGTINTYKVIKK